GPKDLREIPEYFGQRGARASYGSWDIELIAEINNVPRMTRDAIRKEADYLQASGADIIDLGCTPGRPYPELGDVVRELVTAGMRVSVDSLEPDEIRAAVAAGAELVLSVNATNLDVARELGGTSTRVVVIPDVPHDLTSLEPTIAALERWRVKYLIDPI